MIKKMIFVILAAFIFSTVFVYSVDTTQNIEALFNSVKLTINGSGRDVNTILYDNTTYVPIRAIADKLGLSVNWYSGSKTVDVSRLADNTSTADSANLESSELLDSSVWTDNPNFFYSDKMAAQTEWSVFLQDGKVGTVKTTAMHSATVTPGGISQFDVEFYTYWGFFTGIDVGEFGGNLYFQPYNSDREGLFNPIKVLDRPVKGMYQIGDTFYAVTTSEENPDYQNPDFDASKFWIGGIYKLSAWGMDSKRNDTITAARIIDLPDQPVAFTVDTDTSTVYMLTETKLLKIQNDKIVSTILESNDGELPYYLNSMVFLNNSLYSGGYGGITKFDLETKKITQYYYTGN